jgi:hypothetical protein
MEDDHGLGDLPTHDVSPELRDAIAARAKAALPRPTSLLTRLYRIAELPMLGVAAALYLVWTVGNVMQIHADASVDLSPVIAWGSEAFTHHSRSDNPFSAPQESPYTGTKAPLVMAAASPARNSITRATAAGCTHFVKSAVGIAVRLASVSIVDGSTAFTVTPVPWSSWARLRAIARTPAFDAT